mgnify:CR=1 FL=1
MAKPTSLPNWATTDVTSAISGQANKVTPPTAKQATGFAYREKPPRNWFNWWMNLVYQWISWLAGEHTLLIPVTAAILPDDSKFAFASPFAGSTAGFIYKIATDSFQMIFPVPLQQGQRIKSWTLYARSNGATSINGQLCAHDGADGTEQWGEALQESLTAGFKTLGQTGLTLEVPAGCFVNVVVTPYTSDDRIYGLKVVYDEGAF